VLGLGLRFKFKGLGLLRFYQAWCSLLHTCNILVSYSRRRMNKFSKLKVHWWTYNHCLFFRIQPVSHSDTDGYRILNSRNFRIRVGYGFVKIFLDMDRSKKINIRSPLQSTTVASHQSTVSAIRLNTT